MLSANQTPKRIMFTNADRAAAFNSLEESRKRRARSPRAKRKLAGNEA